ncbi:MAG: PQQ-binding-like beta-propeller repeat protein [Kiritimatiellaceae bacterium]|nr:PQQ-binding-like beta-propeller repeat protein [Kiritimatiellaceae bacterium]
MDTSPPFKRGATLAGACLLFLFAQSFALEPNLSGLSGGVLVQVGGGSLLRQFGTNESFFAIGLDTNTANVAILRTALRSEGYSGQVLVDEWNGTDLPFINNFVNALILENLCNVSSAEVARVLVPNGKAYRLQGTNWVAEIKPRPAEMDDWTHYSYSPGNTRVSHDQLIGAPLRRMQWFVWPFWTKYHFGSPAVHFVLSGGGKIFYVVDESPTSTGGGGFPEKWALMARDAFNGKILWRKPMGLWGAAPYHPFGFFESSDMNPAVDSPQQRRFVVDGNRLYGTLSYDGPIVALDATTGEIIRTFTGTESTKETYISDGKLIVFRSVDPKLMIFDPDTGTLLWSDSSYNPLCIAISSNQLCVVRSDGVHGFDMTTLTEQWISNGTKPSTPGGFVVHNGSVVVTKAGASSRWVAYSTSDGQFLWSYPFAANTRPTGVTARPSQLFATTNLIWTFKTDMILAGLNPMTGAEQSIVNASNVYYASHHHRCHDDKATDRFIIAAQEGVEFISLTGATNMLNNWTRGTCNMGPVPANGLMYVPPAACACVYSAMLHGFYSYAGPAADAGRTFSSTNRLTTGSAFGAVNGSTASSNDWPLYRYNTQRLSATTMSVPKQQQKIWGTTVATNAQLTPPVIAGGRLFVANKTDHTICALDATTGAVLWKYAAGGSADSAPSVWGDCVIFGCSDGRVYCLRASDGALVWRFQAAPRDCRNMQLEEVSSVWPVPGSVLVDNGSVYCSAGHSSRLDGGIWFYKLNALTGAVLATNRIENVSPAVPAPTNEGGTDDEGLKNDLFVSDGANLFVREAVFTTNLEATASSRTDHFRSNGNRIVDPSWHHRQDWAFNNVFAQQLCVDGTKAYGIKAYTIQKDFSVTYLPGSGYILFAQDVNVKGTTALAEAGVENELRPHPLTQYTWWRRVPLRVQAMVRAGDYLFVAGQPDVFNRADPFAAFEGRAGGSLWTVSPTNGERVSECTLSSPPVYDGMAAANNALYISAMDGSVACFGQPESAPAAKATVTPASGTTSTVFTFDGTGSQDLDGQIVAYEWRVNGAVVSTNAIYTTSFGTTGGRTVQLTVRDNDGMKGFDTKALSVTSPGTDSDSDGLPDTWETAQAGNLTAMNATSDTDGDGLTDLQEYAYGTNPSAKDTDSDGLADNLEIIAGTDPANADSILQLSGQPLSGNRLQITWDSVSNRSYSIWGSTNLAGGLTELVAHHIAATPPVNTFTDVSTHNGTYFYRLQVTQNIPLPPPNAAPVVRDDEVFTVTNKAVTVSVLDNDTDPDFQSLVVTGVTQGAHGTVLFTTTNVVYTPQSSWTGGTDTFTYTVSDTLGAIASATVTVHVGASVNLVVDPLMEHAHTEVSAVDGTTANLGWCVGIKRSWQWDRANEWSFPFCGVSQVTHPAMAQSIADSKKVKGAGIIRFRATHQGTSDTLKVKVYGGTSFSYAMTTETASGTLLYDSGNVAATEFDWQTFLGAVDFSTGYDYYLVLVWSDGIAAGTDEFIAVDDFYLGK